MRQIRQFIEWMKDQTLNTWIPNKAQEFLDMKASLLRYDVLDKGFVRVIDWMGDDLTGSNAARVSMRKQRDHFVSGDERGSDEKLLKFLAQNDPPHWTPYGHIQITFHFKMPVHIARQFMRSNVGIVYNETSRRYVQDAPEFYEPAYFRSRPEGGIKQGSGAPMGAEHQAKWQKRSLEFHGHCERLYNEAISDGMAPEMARCFFTVDYYTEFWATMSLMAAFRVVKLRIDPHAQKEVQDYAKAMDHLMMDMFPFAWKALNG